jgi:hypothetical protein
MKITIAKSFLFVDWLITYNTFDIGVRLVDHLKPIKVRGCSSVSQDV